MNDNNQQFTWISFYKEFAQKLLVYRKDRTTLLSYIYSKHEELQINYLHDQEGSNDLCPDIDPFTVMGIFNRGIKTENRINIAKQLATFLKIQTAIPTDFEGIPLLNNQMSHFFGFRDKRGKYDIENLWQLFEDLVLNKNIEEDYNKVIKQYIININITMALFWIKPNEYLAFDSKNRTYMRNEYNIELPNYAPEYKEYMKILNDIKAKMSSKDIKEQTFYEISANAFNANYATAKDKQSYSLGTKENNQQMTEQYSYYIKLLKTNHNAILNGAPGTGKTHLAKEIAKEMNATIKMVQFHPSYDYTDFVEGLRPIKDDKGNIGFERKDGVFKEFCRKALIASETSSNEDLFNDLNDNPTVWKVSLGGTGDNPIRTDCLENGWIRIGWNGYGDVEDFNDFEDFKDGGKVILRAFQHTMQVGDIVLSCYSEKEIDAVGIVIGDYEYHDNVSDFQRYRKVKWLVKGIKEDIRSLNRNKVMTLSTIYKLPIMVNDIVDIVNRHSQEQTLAPIMASKATTPFVFIIDEINRGEISKIFGELFFSIDPGYRGKKGKVQTQYQNLVEEGDVFKDGFYVPENVYIIGTMNDIDRSVESMDFAMRRRFAWQEITADESAENMGITGELRERMDSLNKVIEKTEGLGSAYQVGAAMFLKVKDTEENVEGNCGMTVESLWNLNLKSLMKEYLRGLPNEKDILQEMEDAYFLRNKETSDNTGNE